MQDFIERAKAFGGTIAIISDETAYTYSDLLNHSAKFASLLLQDKDDLNECRVAFMVDPGFDYVKVQWGIWRAGGIAVPLCLTHPLPSLQYVIEDTKTSIIVVSPRYESVLGNLASTHGIRSITLPAEATAEVELPPILPDRRAMILYTSGTTNLPKGVVTTHRNLHAQVLSLVDAWEWSSNDAILNVLPLHHVHGIVNVVSCSLYSGASCRFVPAFDAATVFDIFRSGAVNLFMAVPTVYFKLIAYFDALPEDQQTGLAAAMKKFRLMVSGSAALPVTIMERWEKISGHVLLERYGMTEIGMAISNPYQGERRAGCVGIPLPGVQVRLVDEKYEDVGNGEPGEVLVKGENVFSEYWNRPEATADSFTGDGWFKTGDIAILDNGYYRIMGRNSVDIIKSGGYKISALEIEEVLRTHPSVKDCAVVGLENEEWGELVAAALVPTDGHSIDTVALNTWMRERLPGYRVPRQYLVIAELPRNAMGKVTKNDIRKLF